MIDLDLRQKTTARYLANRNTSIARHGYELASPVEGVLPEIDPATLAPGENAHDRRLSQAVAALESSEKVPPSFWGKTKATLQFTAIEPDSVFVATAINHQPSIIQG